MLLTVTDIVMAIWHHHSSQQSSLYHVTGNESKRFSFQHSRLEPLNTTAQPYANLEVIAVKTTACWQHKLHLINMQACAGSKLFSLLVQ